ncbi:MAG: hypothetical protein ABIQ86_04605 [Steroidobacteraceae bacterium]
MKKLVAALAVTVVALSVVAAHMWQQLHEVRVQTAQLRDRITQLQSTQLAAAMMPSAPTTPVAGVVGAQMTDQTATPVPVATGAREKRGTDALIEGIGKMMASPEGREMMLAQARMILPQQYPDLAKELGLTQAEVEKFFDLLARQQADMAGDVLGGMPNGGAQDRTALEERARKAQERQRTNQAEVTAMLGSKYPQWQDYQKTLPARRQVNQLQSTLSNGVDALNDTQSRPLIAALTAEQARIQEEVRNAPRPAGGGPQNALEAQLQRAAETNRRLISVASSFLNPQQVEGYRRMLEQEENLSRMMMRSINPQGIGVSQAAPGR